METAVENQLQVVENSMAIFQSAPQILQKHQLRSAKALLVARDILDKWNAAFAIKEPDIRMEALKECDDRSMKFLANATNASKEMQDARKSVTQIMDLVREMFTREENSLDVKKGEFPAAIQKNRNTYATEVIVEQERQRKLSESRALKEKEANEIRSFINSTITKKLYEFLAQRKLFYTESFNTISLTDFEERSAKLRNLNTTCPQDKIAEAIRYDMPRVNRHDDTEMNMLRIKEHEAFDFQSFYFRYNNEITELKQSLIDRLPSKLAELKEAKVKADQAEKERLAELEYQRQAQIQRDKDIAAAGAKKKAELEAANILAQEKEKGRLAALAAKTEIDRIEAEAIKSQREQDERNRLASEAEANRLQAEQEAELKKAADDAVTLFNQTAEVASNSMGPEVRSSIVITVTHAAGWAELFQFWFMNAGSQMPLEEIEKMTFEKLKKFAEKSAKDSGSKKGTRIESKLLTYSDSVSAVNRKAK